MECVGDEQLWADAVAGDGLAFAALYRRHVDRVLTLSARRIGSIQDAPEVADEAFLQAWRSRKSARLVDGSLLPWLLAIANNVAHKHLRSRTRRLALLHRVPAETESPDHADAVVDRLDTDQRVKDLALAIAQLPAIHREVISLCDLGGLDYSAAAEALAIPIGTIRSRRSRAINALQSLLEPPQRTCAASPTPAKDSL